MDSEDQNEAFGQSGSFFMDGLTFAPGAGKHAEVPIPEPTDEFKFLNVLGVGGMGIVYEAEELRTGRHVALKVIAPRLRLTEDVVVRFEQEARTSAQLSHPNCVFVYGAYRIGGSPAIAMELMSGDTLDDRIKLEDQISVTDAVKWTRDMLAGLDAAHDAGLIHRDIKPSNVFIGSQGEAKIGDFGLTRSAEGDLSLTQSGAFLGSPLYASPEQIRGRDVDQQTDIYSVGATLYALLAGAAPHTSTNIGDLFARITTEDPKPIRQLRPDVPRSLEKMILKALSRDKKKRFADCESFHDALLPFSGKTTKGARILVRVGAFFVDIVLVYVIPLTALQFYFNEIIPEEGHITIGNRKTQTPEYIAEAIFAGYFLLTEAFFGASLGKRILGLQVVGPHGDHPGFFRSLVRVVLLEVAFFCGLLSFSGNIFRLFFQDLINLVWFGVLASTMRRRNGYRALQDFLSGTRVVEMRENFDRSRDANILLNPNRIQAGIEKRTRGHYKALNPWIDTDHGPLWVGRDERLNREVWIFEEISQKDRASSGVGLHFLDRVQDEDGIHLVFESPGGASILEYRTSDVRIPWSKSRSILLGLTAIMRDYPKVQNINRLWIGRKGQMRLLPFALSEVENRDGFNMCQDVVCSIFDLDSVTSPIPEDIPEDGRDAVRFLLKGSEATSADWQRIHTDIESTDAQSRIVSRGIRGAQMLLSCWFPLLMAGIWIALSLDKLEQDDPKLVQVFLKAFLVLGGLIIFPAVISAVIFRGCLGFSLFGIRVVDSRSRHCGRAKCVARACLTWGSLTILLAAGQFLWLGTSVPFAGYIVLAFYAAYLAMGAWAIWNPARSLADRILGTQLVR